jgi:hypothetical protein
MTVHKAITTHSKNQAQMVATFKKMDLQREAEIEKVLNLRNENKPFSLDEVNKITKEMNEFRKQANFELPVRKLVTEEMVNAYFGK